MPKLIIHTESSRGWGGQEARVLTELVWLGDNGYRPMLMAPADSEILKRATDKGIKCIPVDFGKWSQLWNIFELMGLFMALKPHAVGTHSTIDSRVGLIAGKMAGVPQKLRYRHVSVPVRNNWYNRFLYGSCADHIITTGDCINKILMESLTLPAEKFSTIATGIAAPALEMLPAREAAREKLCAQFGLPPESRFVGCVAILRGWKGHKFLLEAFEMISQKFPAHHLVLVGDGPQTDILKAQAATLKSGSRIHFAGYQTNVFDYFRAFDVSVLASFGGEGIPQTVLQAYFAQTAVVATTVGGIPEVVEDGRTGLLCAPSDAKALAEAMTRTLDDPAATATRVQAAYQQATQKHTVEAMGAALKKIIGEP